MGDVLSFPPPPPKAKATKEPKRTPRMVFKEGREAKLQQCLLIGWTPEGHMFIAGAVDTATNALWMLEAAKMELMNIGHET